MMQIVEVRLASQPYAIEVQPDALSTLGARIRALTGATRALLIADEAVMHPHAEYALHSVLSAGIDVTLTTIIAEERRKTLDTVHELYAEMLKAKLDRHSVVIALGGGIVGDVAGFAAATFLRGIRIVQVPTTLLAMVDASIGGKTGVNIALPGRTELGKNLIGAFWQPAGVIIDPETLRTLEPREFRSGLGECLKHGIIADAGLFEFLAEVGPSGASLDTPELADLIAQAADVKAAIVAEDEREHGRRVLLNLGHTFAHAIEPIAAMNLHHGEAVAIGLCAAAHTAQSLDRLDAHAAQRIVDVVEACGLPTRLPIAWSAHELLDMMRFDKKVKDDTVRLVLPTRIGAAAMFDDVDPAVILETWRAIGADT
jgi:3-dehydroquinate synthase